MNVLSLFAGIGGIDLGLERAGMTAVGQVEIDPKCQRVLARHWPEVPRHEDVRTTLDWWGSEERPTVNVVAGGYPCPAFSQAARGRNVAPDLWPYMRDVIDGLRPDYVLLENVRAHLGRGFTGVLADLNALGFDAEWTVVHACSVGASHPRPRLLAIAYPHRDGEPVFSVNGEAPELSPTARDRGRWGVPTAHDVRADDGVPYRVDRVRMLGNAVVPQVAEVAGSAIAADAMRRGLVLA